MALPAQPEALRLELPLPAVRAARSGRRRAGVGVGGRPPLSAAEVRRSPGWWGCYCCRCRCRCRRRRRRRRPGGSGERVGRADAYTRGGRDARAGPSARLRPRGRAGAAGRARVSPARRAFVPRAGTPDARASRSERPRRSKRDLVKSPAKSGGHRPAGVRGRWLRTR